MKGLINTTRIAGKLQNLNYPVAKQVGVQGSKGIKGDPGQGFNWAGDFDPLITYYYYDVVNYNGSLYIAVQNNFFGILPSNSTYWDQMLASSGSGSMSATVDVIAGENLAPYRVVYVDTSKVYKASKDTISERDKILGITNGSYSINTLATVYVYGTVTNSSWNWLPGLVYLNVDGTLTQTIPTSGYQIQIGKAIDTTTIIIDIDRVIEDHNHDDEYINVGEIVNGGTF